MSKKQRLKDPVVPFITPKLHFTQSKMQFYQLPSMAMTTTSILAPAKCPAQANRVPKI
jgi:hypothetical protein